MSIAFIVSGNGYGHLKRVFLVVREIYSMNNAVRIVIFGASHHYAMLQKWMAFDGFSKFQFSFVNAQTERNLVAPLPQGYSFFQYEQSIHNIQKAVLDNAPDIIVSDNLVGMLKPFPKALLMGSFLFTDTLPVTTNEIERIRQFENDLLEKLKPTMIGVEDMAMPAIRMKTNFLGLPWFCIRKNLKPIRRSDAMKNILLAGGGTMNAIEKIIDVCTDLNPQELNLFADKSIYEAFDRVDIKLFDFTTESFQFLDWIICRPGMGILTDAVEYCVPVMSVYEDNAEMKHNAARIEELSMGYNITNAVGNLPDMLRQDTTNLLISIRKRLTGGAAKAAHIILKS